MQIVLFIKLVINKFNKHKLLNYYLQIGITCQSFPFRIGLINYPDFLGT
jgi:hypothetical protein